MPKTVLVNTTELQTMINILYGVINNSIERSGFQAMFYDNNISVDYF